MTHPKKVAIIDHVGIKAGMDYYSKSLAEGLSSNGVSCTVFSNFIPSIKTVVNYCDMFDSHTDSNPLTKLMRFIYADIKSSVIARRNKTDLTILHLFSTDLITLLLIMIPKVFGLKIAIIAHDISSFTNNDNSLIQSIIYNLLANDIVVHNNFSKEILLKHVSMKSAEKIHVIKHGGYQSFIGEPITRSEARKQLNLDQEKKYLLFFGQIKTVKGLDILLKALSNVSADIHLIIAGKPWKSDFEEYQNLIEQYSLQHRVKLFIRFISDEERKLFFFAADVNVLPYRIIYQSGVLLMAMSHGLPVIASDLPPNREIIQDSKNGLLFTSENSDSLANCIQNFFSNKTIQSSLSKSALDTINNDYNWENITQKYLDILSNAK